DAPGAEDLLAREAALRAAAPTPGDASYYEDLLRFPGALGDVERKLLDPAVGRQALAGALRAYVRSFPVSQPLVLDLQPAFPQRVPNVLPPKDLREALSPYARKRLAAGGALSARRPAH